MPRRRGATQQTTAIQTKTGPWKGVVTTGKDPWDTPRLDTLLDAYNGYIPDARGGSGLFYRPGLNLTNNGQRLSATSSIRGQGVIDHIDPSGVAYNFVVYGGKMYRADAQFVLFVDVTPVDVEIDDGPLTKVYGTSLGTQLVISDGINDPWLASSLSSTPIVGTYIPYNAGEDDWSLFGPPRVYSGALVGILAEVDGTSQRTSLVWSAPGDASAGYEQATYDNQWELIESSSDPLFAIAPTETQLYYFREDAIGFVAGPIGPSWQSNSTPGALAQNVGTVFPQSVVLFGSQVYFCDQMGRPYKLVGQQLSPIYLQMRGIIDTAPLAYPTVNANVASAAYEPYLNMYLAAPFSTNTFLQSPPVEGYWFDVRTANYMGRFCITAQNDKTLPTQIDCMGNFTDPSGRQVLVVVGSVDAQENTAPADSGYVWTLNSNVGQGVAITTEGASPLVITTEDGVGLATEGTTQNWQDGEQPPIRMIQTQRLGYQSDTILNVDRVTILVGDEDPLTVSASTAQVVQSVQCIPTPNPSEDGVNRATAAFDGVMGRGCAITVQPTTAFEQASIQSVTLFGTLSNALPDDN